ncbi:MAG TPA: 50S ribosomal protein L25/general stress protein Ctc [bacterium]|nr:50S ribosomal protein L25/general stress protein Ctc [bacterium]HOL67950.1 50S ribosomal protein L25/general stress protein Ctc [bacterium]HPP12029.1 50S ribosomal protein L25/general stress protein Ctc [bacterium]
MEEILFQAEVRETTGKGVARKLRQAGFVPGILYGPGEEPVALKVEGKSAGTIVRRLRSHNIMADLVLKGSAGEEKIKTILKDVQKDPLTGALLHLDFYRVRMDRPVAMEIPIQLVGESVGVSQGGILEQELREAKLEALPRNMPDRITVDISTLGIGHALLVKDLKLPEGVRALDDPERVVVAVLAPAKEEEAAPVTEEVTAAATEPEVISEEKAEERRKMKEEAKQEEAKE